MFVHNFGAPLPPLSSRKVMDFLWILYEKNSYRIANTQQKLRSNSPIIAKKRNYEQRGVSELNANERN